VDNRGSNSTGCFRIKVRTDAAELTNMRIAGLGVFDLITCRDIQHWVGMGWCYWHISHYVTHPITLNNFSNI